MRQLAARQPYEQWLRENQIHPCDHLPTPAHVKPTNHKTILLRQRAFGCITDEDLKFIMAQMGCNG